MRSPAGIFFSKKAPRMTFRSSCAAVNILLPGMLFKNEVFRALRAFLESFKDGDNRALLRALNRKLFDRTALIRSSWLF